jgi:hypothetical protein
MSDDTPTTGDTPVTGDEPSTPLPHDPFTLEGIIAQEPERPVWYRRGWVLVTAAVVALIGASVLVDLPTHTTVATDTADQAAIMKQINTALAGCSYGVKETFTIYQAQRAGTLSDADRSLTPSMLRDDQSACSFTSSSIYDLSNVQGTGTRAGKSIGLVVNVATLWATSDALAAVEDIQTLSTDPTNAKAIADLPEREAALAQGRAQAIGYVQDAERFLHAKLPMPDMPDLPTLHLPTPAG